MKRAALYNQTPNGVTVRSGLVTQDEAIHAWAERIVKHVNDATMSSAPREFDDEGNPIIPPGPQPIELRPGDVPREPYMVKLGEKDTYINRVNEKDPYRNLAPGEIRLFKGINSSTLTDGVRGVENPARTWFPNYNDAMAAAGVDGHVYSFDASIADAKKFLIASPSGSGIGAGYLEDIAARQQAGDIPRLGGGYFEPPRPSTRARPTPSRTCSSTPSASTSSLRRTFSATSRQNTSPPTSSRRVCSPLQVAAPVASPATSLRRGWRTWWGVPPTTSPVTRSSCGTTRARSRPRAKHSPREGSATLGATSHTR